MVNYNELQKRLLGVIEAARFEHTCLGCEHFAESSEVCAVYKQRPPARVIVQGCSAFEPIVPF